MYSETQGLDFKTKEKLGLHSREIIWLQMNPYALDLLMDFEDLTYSEASSIGLDVGPWPTKRYVELYEQGRSIMKEDVEIWPDKLRKRFGFTRPTTLTRKEDEQTTTD